MHFTIRFFQGLLFLGFLFSCTHIEKTNEPIAKQIDTTSTAVDFYIIKNKPFTAQFISTGIIYSSTHADIKTMVAGKIIRLNVKNGAKVKKGDILVVLDNTEAKLNENQSFDNYTKAVYGFENELISLGYSLKDTANIPKKMLQAAKIKSGLISAKDNLQIARYKLSLYTIKAGFSGIVANLNALPENYLTQGATICTLLNAENYYIVCPLLLEEVGLVKVGTTAQINPLSGGSFLGKLSEINPVVDKNGMVNVKISFKISSKYILHGAKADVLVKKPIPNLLSVPVSAIVKRGKHKVIYSIKQQKAIWNEVSVISENDEFAGIKSELKPGDTIISSNNIYLNHQAPIRLKIN